jgi:hypothetical protein
MVPGKWFCGILINKCILKNFLKNLILLLKSGHKISLEIYFLYFFMNFFCKFGKYSKKFCLNNYEEVLPKKNHNFT